MKAEEIQHLRFIYNRMIEIHKENRFVDYMHEMDRILKELEIDLDETNVGESKEREGFAESVMRAIMPTKKEKETISIDGYEFYKPDFECELWKVVELKSKYKIILGYVNGTLDEYQLFSWDLDGVCTDNKDNEIKDHNLTPKKPEWHTTEQAQKALRELSAICEDDELYAKLNEFITPF